MRVHLRHGDMVHEVEVTADADGHFTVTLDGAATLRVAAVRRGDALNLVSERGTVRAWVTRDGATRWVSAPGFGDSRLERVAGRRTAHRDAGGMGGDLTSPMPGRVVRVLVAAGDEVARGAPLVVVEAMKTELTIAAPRAGRVAAVHAREGEMCDAGRPLIELAAEAAAEARAERAP